ncbi:CheR family methyltransferase [Tundrisphaera lichenicola]|uniref:CheR family methyltransferase n=1 Tax=Tundrisphaera lichenicola TaxID=2029860 RepID=UPI003EBE8627
MTSDEPESESESLPPDPDFESLLDYLHRSRGFDFTGYKHPSLIRRIGKRMKEVRVDGYVPYVDFLEVHPDEFKLLFDTILINVTSFFRDPPAWKTISEEILPRLLSSKRAEDPIRVWSAGCATGQEAYSLAIVLAEALGIDAFRDRVKIYATDVDDDALAKARSAQYDAKELESLPPEFREKYFEPAGAARWSFQKDLRRSVIFGRHDLIQDAPISRVDLLTCRNTLMYFNSETQARILDRFHYALSDRGFLMLGKVETLMTYNSSFIPVDLKRRIFARVPRANQLRDRILGQPRAAEETASHLVSHVRLREFAFESSPVAQLVIDFSGLLALANERARTMFQIDPVDLGRPFQDLTLSYRPADLRSCIDRAYQDRQPARISEVEWPVGAGEVVYLNIHVVPLLDPGAVLLGASVSFTDATGSRRLQEELQASHKELEVANEELQSTNEELETINEELQSTIEELETTNEELQSTNEELETMNEELQSTNDEIEVVNGELRVRNEERDTLDSILQSILRSLSSGVIVVGSNFSVQLWNPRAEDLWGIRSDEAIGKNLLNLDIGLPLEEIKKAIISCLAGELDQQVLTVDARTRRGKAIRCRVTCQTMTSEAKAINGVILSMDEEPAVPA